MRNSPLILFPLLLLAACVPAIQPAPDTGPVATWQQRQTRLRTVDNWTLRGRAALKIGNEGHQLNLSWKRAGEFHVLQLAGPLNQGGLWLKREPGRARLLAEDGKTYEGPSAEVLLSRVLGWRLPVSGLDYWVRGLPDPEIEAEEELDARNRLVHLLQGEWEIRYLAYQQVADMELPATLFIKSVDNGQGGLQRQVELRVAISEWKLRSD